jgi:hypothetical protein
MPTRGSGDFIAVDISLLKERLFSLLHFLMA